MAILHRTESTTLLSDCGLHSGLEIRTAWQGAVFLGGRRSQVEVVWQRSGLSFELFLNVAVHGQEDIQVILGTADDPRALLVVQFTQVVHIDCLVVVQLVQQGGQDTEPSPLHPTKPVNITQNSATGLSRQNINMKLIKILIKMCTISVK